MNLAVLCSAHVCFHCLGSMTLQGLKDVSVKLKSASTYQNQAMASWPYFKNQMIYHSRHISVVDVIGPCHAKYPQIPKKKHQAQKLFGHEVRFLQHYCWWFRHPAPVDMINMPCVIFRVLYIFLVLGRISEPISRMYIPKKNDPRKTTLHPNLLDAVVPKLLLYPV